VAARLAPRSRTGAFDLDRKTGQCESNGSYRQALLRAEGVRTEPIAGELAESIIARSSDQRLKSQGGETVRLLTAAVVPYDSGYMADGRTSHVTWRALPSIVSWSRE
jgi:hypothetical protein